MVTAVIQQWKLLSSSIWSLTIFSVLMFTEHLGLMNFGRAAICLRTADKTSAEKLSGQLDALPSVLFKQTEKTFSPIMGSKVIISSPYLELYFPYHLTPAVPTEFSMSCSLSFENNI